MHRNAWQRGKLLFGKEIAPVCNSLFTTNCHIYISLMAVLVKITCQNINLVKVNVNQINTDINCACVANSFQAINVLKYQKYKKEKVKYPYI